WRRHGRFLQLMDPTMGRRWITARRFSEEVYVHSMSIPGEGWQAWARSDPSLAVLRRQLRDVGVGGGLLDRDRPLPALDVLDAALRMVRALVRSGAVRRGKQAAGV